MIGHHLQSLSVPRKSRGLFTPHFRICQTQDVVHIFHSLPKRPSGILVLDSHSFVFSQFHATVHSIPKFMHEFHRRENRRKQWTTSDITPAQCQSLVLSFLFFGFFFSSLRARVFIVAHSLRLWHISRVSFLVLLLPLSSLFPSHFSSIFSPLPFTVVHL